MSKLRCRQLNFPVKNPLAPFSLGLKEKKSCLSKKDLVLGSYEILI